MKYSDYRNLFIKEELPKPLNKEQFEYYFKKYQDGDLEAKNVIIEHNIKLVLSRIYKKFKNHPLEVQQELFCVGMENLIKALSRFDLSYHVAFSTYVVKVIDNEMLIFLRNNKKNNLNLSLDDSVFNDKDGNELKIEETLIDKNVDIMADYEEKENISAIRRLIRKLPSPDREIVILHFGFDGNRTHTQVELATLYNFSQAQISIILKKNVNFLRIKLYELGIIETTRKCTGKYKDNIPKKISEHQQMILQLKKIIDHFHDYPKTQLLQALQIYISDLSPICSDILTLYFNTDKIYKRKVLAIKLNCSEWVIYNNLKKLNQKLESKSLFEELSLILSQMTSEIKKVKTSEQSMKKYIINETVSNTDNHTFITDFELLKDDIKNNSLFNNQLFEQALSKFDKKDQGVIIFKLNNCSIDDISKIFKIDKDNLEYITDITRNFLLFYKDLASKYIDNVIDLVVTPHNGYLKKF